jgi:hypothetical protein
MRKALDEAGGREMYYGMSLAWAKCRFRLTSDDTPRLSAYASSTAAMASSEFGSVSSSTLNIVTSISSTTWGEGGGEGGEGKEGGEDGVRGERAWEGERRGVRGVGGGAGESGRGWGEGE